MTSLGRRLGLVVLLLVLMSSTTLASKFVPFINTMLLGRTFDYSKSEVGNDIISEEERNKAEIIPNDRSDINCRIVRSIEDVRDVLDVTGQLSVKVLAGTVNVEGKESYLKSSVESGNTVEVMAQVYYKKVTKTLHDDMKLLKNWDKNRVTGQHYIRSLIFGGYLIASFKFHVSNEEEKEEIKASVEVDLNTVKAEVGVKGLFENLASSARSQSSLTITYTSNVISDKVSVDLPTLIEVIENFKHDMSKINNGNGVPLLTEIRELSFLRNNPNEAQEKYKFLRNSMLGQNMEILATMFHDLKVTSDALENAVQDKDDMTVEQENQYGEFNYKLSTISDSFYKAIQNLDLNANTASDSQFNEALTAYKEGKDGFLPGKFLREFHRFKRDHPLGDPGLHSIGKKVKEIRKKVRSLELRLSGEEMVVEFPKENTTVQYMITRGAPEMNNIMVCFSTRSLAEEKPHTYFSYSTTSYKKNGKDMKAATKIEFKIASDKQERILVFREGSVLKFEGENVKSNDRGWHSWCFYWDKSGMTRVYKDARMVGEKQGLAAGKKIEGGGSWIVGQEETRDGSIKSSASFRGEITNVNVYGNFDKEYFQDTVAHRVTSTTCRPTIYNNIVKSWADFKIGLVGKLKVLSKDFCQYQ